MFVHTYVFLQYISVHYRCRYTFLRYTICFFNTYYVCVEENISDVCVSVCVRAHIKLWASFFSVLYFPYDNKTQIFIVSYNDIISIIIYWFIKCYQIFKIEDSLHYVTHWSSISCCSNSEVLLTLYVKGDENK